MVGCVIISGARGGDPDSIIFAMKITTNETKQKKWLKDNRKWLSFSQFSSFRTIKITFRRDGKWAHTIIIQLRISIWSGTRMKERKMMHRYITNDRHPTATQYIRWLIINNHVCVCVCNSLSGCWWRKNEIWRHRQQRERERKKNELHSFSPFSRNFFEKQCPWRSD